MGGAISGAILAIVVVLLAAYADHWRRKDPVARKDQAPPAFTFVGKVFLYFILIALIYAIVMAL